MQSNGINDMGVVVGGYARSSGEEGAFIRLPDGTFQSFQYLGDPRTGAFGINNSGQISGQSGAGSFLRNPDGSFVSISYSGSSDTQAFGLNNLGQVVGMYSTDRAHGFLRDPDGTMQTIDVPGGVGTLIWAINDEGQLAGYVDESDGNRYAFIATPIPEPAALNLLLLGLTVLASVRCCKGKEKEIRG